MRKALLPMFASLLVCGAATAALVMSSAHAQTTQRKPVMVAALVSPAMQMAAATPADPPPPPRPMPSRAEIAAHFKQMCQDRYAWAAGRLAFLEVKLTLTPAQEPLFQRWREVQLGIAKHRADDCAARPLPDRTAGRKAARPSPVERLTRQEDRLKQRIADLDAERPALEALYGSLSPAQKEVLDQAHRHPMLRAMARHRFFAGGPGMDHRPPGPMDGMDRRPPPPHATRD